MAATVRAVGWLRSFNYLAASLSGPDPEALARVPRCFTPRYPMATTRRLLLVSCNFPPSSEVGAARWEGFAPFLVEAGWAVDVVMELPVPALRDDARRERLGSLVTVVAMVPRRDPIWRQTVLRAVEAIRGRSSSVTPAVLTEVFDSHDGASAPAVAHARDAFSAVVFGVRQRKWIADVEKAGAQLAVIHKPTVIVSSGPPHDAHVAAHRIAQRLHVPHVVDLRDPWSGNPGDAAFHRLGVSLSPTREAAEHRVLSAAAAIITNTAAASRALVARKTEISARVHTVLNGSDTDAWPPRVLLQDDAFLIVHTGTLYMDRDPRPFFRAVNTARQELGANGSRIKVVFMGHPTSIAGQGLTQCAAEFGIADCFEERAFNTRESALQLMRSASMLVAFQGATTTQIPAKIFDYVSNSATLLALTNAYSATASLLHGSSARIADLHDEGAIVAEITSAASRAFAGEPIVPVDHDGRFSRSKQAAHLLRLLDTLAL
jgi:glycosyltransferase involved in cell wall biosynthesis